MKSSVLPQNFIKFLGTAGARVVLSKQLRSSGGIWVSLGEKNILIDPGPGTLVRCWGSNPPMDPSTLDAIILTHRHLDHSGDMNVMVEAMAEGGFNPHGQVFAPLDALDGTEPILFHYVRRYLDRINVLAQGANFNLGEISVESPIKNIHPVETYGVKLTYQDKTVAFVGDTRYFPELIDAYQADVLVLNTTFVTPYHGEKVYHLSCEEAIPLIIGIKPKRVILTHFASLVLKEGPDKVAERLQEETGVPVVPATDGMVFPLDFDNF